MSIPILATKLHIPLPRPDLVQRPRLMTHLNAGLHRKLTLVSAPAGFGKTTLLSTWLAESGHPAAWLSLEAGDSDPVQFLTYMVAALQTADGSIGQTVLDALHTSQPPTLDALLTPLLNDLAALPDRLVLVLDDYHVIESNEVDQALAFLLEHLPPQLHMVIATREDPQLPLARLRVRNQLTECRVGDLRFTTDEAADFLNQVMGLHLLAADVAALERRTEGWIAGLQLAALSMQGRADSTAFIDMFTGSHRFVVDYLVEEVLRRQPEPIRRFLLHTSILERLNGALCDAVTEGHGSQKMLETLERGNLFVVPLDSTRDWYRYHHLFAEALRNYVLHEQPETVPALHRRASIWYTENDFPHDAIRHALASGDFQHAADLIERVWPPMDEYYQSGTWMGWAKMLPGEVVLNRPILCVGYGRSLLYTGELEAAELWLQAAERWLNTPAEARHSMRVADEVQFEMLPAAIQCARAYRALAEGDFAASLHYTQRALEVVIESDELSRIQAIVLSATAYLANGDLARADQTLSDFTAQMQSRGRMTDAIELVYVIGDIRTTCGQLRRAYRAYEHAFQLVADLGNPLLISVEDLYRGVAELYREWGQFDTAEDHLLAAEELSEQNIRRPGWQHRLCMTWARLKVSQGEMEAALALLDEAQQHTTRLPLPLVQPAAAAKARIWIAQGKLDAAQAWALQYEITPEGNITYLREYEFITLARLLIARSQQSGAVEGMQVALRLLARLLEAAEEGGKMGSAIEILILQALAYDAQGDRPGALVPLQRALTLAEPEGYLRLFVDEGAPMAVLLAEAFRQNIRPEYTRRLLAGFTTSPVKAAAVQPLIEPLSERELDVLRLLNTDLNGPDIARQLMVSLNTMRTHTKNIYSKLGINSRRAAVRRAEELGLL
ncbi:MAG: LuxR C-terminal-related transcriptional regulator [Anaerolineae bacterium]